MTVVFGSEEIVDVCCRQDLFQPAELQAMVVGNENYDWQELERVSDRCNLISFMGLLVVSDMCHLVAMTESQLVVGSAAFKRKFKNDA